MWLRPTEGSDRAFHSSLSWLQTVVCSNAAKHESLVGSDLPVVLLVKDPPSSNVLLARIRLCRFSASDRRTALPWTPSDGFPQRPSRGTSSPAVLLLALWPASQALLGLLWGSGPGAACSLMEGRREISCSSSSGMGLYQISPSSSASFSSAGSMFWRWTHARLELASVDPATFTTLRNAENYVIEFLWRFRQRN